MKPDLYKFATKSINRVLKDKPEFNDQLRSYRGSIIFIDFLNTNTRVYMVIRDAGVEISEYCDDKPDLTIRATPLELINYFTRVNNNEVSGAGNIEISGNIALAQKLQTTAVKYDIDWEEKLSLFIGDEFSHSIFYVLGKVAKDIRYGICEVRNNFSEVVKYEKNLVISNNEFIEFNDSIDRLRDEVDKLSYRINRINHAFDMN